MPEDRKIFDFECVGVTLVLIPSGQFTEFRDHDIRNAYNEAYRMVTQPEVRHLLVDFSGLTYFGSTFVGILIRLAKKVRGDGGQAVLCHLTDDMREMMNRLMLLENPRIESSWKNFATRQEALAFLGGESTS